MIEFEIPFVCLIFTTLISIIFFTKKKIDLQENYYYKNILIFTLLVNATNFISHYMASIFAKDYISDWFAIVFASINKLGSLFIVIIATNILSYILYISFEKYRHNFYFCTLRSKKIDFRMKKIQIDPLHCRSVANYSYICLGTWMQYSPRMSIYMVESY